MFLLESESLREPYEDLRLVLMTVCISLQESVQFRASFMGPLPLQEYYELIDAHFEVNIFLFRFSFS